MKRRTKSIAGFSLLEVVIALAILSLCIIPIVACMSGGLKFNDTALRNTEAAGVLANVVSDLRSASSSGSGYVSPLYKFQIPRPGGLSTISSSATPEQAFVDDSGSVIAANGVTPSQDQIDSSFFCISVGFSPPATGRSATCARIVITWPPAANPTLATWPSNYKGIMEDTIYLDLN